MLCVVAIVVGAGVPAFIELIANNRMSTAVNDFVSSVHAARSEAIKRQRVVAMCAARDGGPNCDNDAGFGDGWLIYVDNDADGEFEPGSGEEAVLTHGALRPELASGLSVGPAPDSTYVAFSPRGLSVSLPGLGSPVSQLQLCDSRGDRDTGGGIAAGRWLLIQPTGHPVIHRTVASLRAGPLGGC